MHRLPQGDRPSPSRGHRCARGRRALKLAIAALAAACAGTALAQPPAQCPQPRFTGAAPAEYLERTNPLPASAGHGRDGDGRGPMAEQFSPPPRNFRCAQTVNGVADGQLFWIIRFGSPGTAMPPHPGFSDADVWELVSYLRQLAR